jgi:hypothetical protein
MQETFVTDGLSKLADTRSITTEFGTRKDVPVMIDVKLVNITIDALRAELAQLRGRVLVLEQFRADIAKSMAKTRA